MRDLCLGGRAGSDGKRERAGAEASLLSFPFPAFRLPAAVSPSPQVYGQEAFTVKTARKRPLRG